MTTTRPFSLGSRWLRWDPHLHTPGTALNDQFRGDWAGYMQAIGSALPPVAVLGITDYFTLRGYKAYLEEQQKRPIPSVSLAFPNVELRLPIQTRAGQGINLHLLVCPDDPNHVRLIEEKLARLTFPYLGEPFPCTEAGLIRLGRAHEPSQKLDEDAAIEIGANQFKVAWSDIQLLFQDEWIRANVLVAVAAGNDGLAGIAKDSSFHAQREELGRLAQLVFSSNASDRLFWLSQQPTKPCLHGSDAHRLEKVLAPEYERRCWIRGEPTFDALRQVLVEPERRVHIGDQPPAGPDRAEVIETLSLQKASWFENGIVSFNSGLVTIIGARGSGKTALADLLAFAAGAYDATPGTASFIGKAGGLLDGAVAEVGWADGAKTRSTLPLDLGAIAEPRVQYLSQQFVERLCAPGELAGPLIEEIERVVFNAIPEEDRLECSEFAELRNIRLENTIAEREFVRSLISAKSTVVAREAAVQRGLPALRTKAEEAERARAALEKELVALPVAASDAKVKAHAAAAARLQALKDAIAAQERRAQGFRDVAADIQRQLKAAGSAWDALKEKHGALLDAATWDLLRLRAADTAVSTLAGLEQQTTTQISVLRERGLPAESPNPVTPSVAAPAGLAPLTAECDRWLKELGLDQANAKRRLDLARRLAAARTEEERLKKELAYAQEWPSRSHDAKAERIEQYEQIFHSLAAEETELTRLYAPLRSRTREEGRLSKLTFSVYREIDLETWARRGESLLDLRRPPFAGRGTLADKARTELLPAWSRGLPHEVRAAMESFLNSYATEAVEALAQDSTPLDFGEWVFSTDHIRVRYGIEYEGVELERLSPGARGIVLLTLYLALDQWDLRPLIIDQPEENLDPSSIYTDLVPFFRDAAKRRQIIMVTHNANLVVNTDSDQVVVASAERTLPAALPQITYVAGGLEDPQIRSDVCRLLEGGEEAFRKRGQRYGVQTRWSAGGVNVASSGGSGPE